MIDVIAQWNKDPEFQKLGDEEKQSILVNFFDKNLADDEFMSLPQEEQESVKANFMADNGFTPKPAVSAYRLAAAPFESAKDVARSFTAGLGGLLEHGLPDYARSGLEVAVPALKAVPRGLPTEGLGEQVNAGTWIRRRAG